MTRDEQLKCIEDNLEAFKHTLLAKGIEDSAQLGQNGNSPVGDGLRQRRLGLKDGQGADAPIPMAKQLYGL